MCCLLKQMASIAFVVQFPLFQEMTSIRSKKNADLKCLWVTCRMQSANLILHTLSACLKRMC